MTERRSSFSPFLASLVALSIVSASPCLCASSMARSSAAVPGPESHRAVVYTARVDGGMPHSLAELERIAREQGTVEEIRFDAARGPAEVDGRRLLRVGSARHRYPGFSANLRQLLDDGGGRLGSLRLHEGGRVATLAAADDETALRWDLPARPGIDALRFRVDRRGAEVLDAWVHEVARKPAGALWPVALRIDVPRTGGSIVQFIDHGAASPPASDLGPFARPARGVSVVHTDSAARAPGAAAEVDYPGDSVAYDYSLTGLSFDFDSGWQPPGNEEPGGWPMQLRFQLGGGFDVASQVAGTFELDGEYLILGTGAGDLAADFGAEMELLAALDLYIFDPFVMPVPFVPYFDLRAQDQASFDSFLLDDRVEIEDDGRGLLMEAPLAGLPWLFEGGVAAHAAVHMDGSMSAESITTDDALRFDAEGEQHWVRAPDGVVHTTTHYNERLDLDTQVWIFPSGFLTIFGLTWHYALPLGIEWIVTEGQFDMDMTPSDVDFELLPGDLLWSFGAPPQLGDSPRGVEWVEDRLWATTSGADNWLHEMTKEGELLRSLLQPEQTGVEGWGDLARDPDFLYAGAQGVVDQIDPSTGEVTGVAFPAPLTELSGLAFDRSSDQFWGGDGYGEIVAFDRQGVERARFAGGLPVAGLAWDGTDPAQPWLWVATEVDAVVRQFDPLTGGYTGLEFDAALEASAAGGAYQPATGAWIGGSAEQPPTFFGLKVAPAYQPDTVFVEVLETTTDRNFVLPGQPIALSVRWRFEDTIAPDTPADIALTATIGEDDDGVIDPWQTETATIEEVVSGVYVTRFDFEIPLDAPLDVDGLGGAELLLLRDPGVLDARFDATFVVGQNPDAGAITAVMINSATGRGVGDLRVDLVRGNGDPTGQWTMTEPSGSFLIASVDPGSYYLESGHDWYADARHPALGSIIVDPRVTVDRDTLQVEEAGMAYIEVRPESPSRYEVDYFPQSLAVNTSFTRHCEYRWVRGLADEPTEGYFFAFEDENLGTNPGYMRLWFDLPADAPVSDVGLTWKGIGKKSLYYKVYAYYKMNDTPIWRDRDRYIYDSTWLDYSHLGDAGLLLEGGGRNKFRFGTTNETDWSEHIVDTMRWDFFGWHPE